MGTQRGTLTPSLGFTRPLHLQCHQLTSYKTHSEGDRGTGVHTPKALLSRCFVSGQTAFCHCVEFVVKPGFRGSPMSPEDLLMRGTRLQMPRR